MTAPGSGLGSVPLATGVEVTYGTLPALTKALPVDSAEIKWAPTYYKGQGLHGNTLARFDAETVLVQGDAAGSVKTPIYFNGVGRLLGSVQGSLGVAPVVNGATTSYTQTHAFANTWGQSLSIVSQIRDVAQASHYFATLGAKVTDAQFECAAGNPLLGTFTIDAQDHYELGTPPAMPADPGGSPFFTWKDMAVKIGAFGSEALVDGVTKWQATHKRTHADKRFNAGNLSLNPNKRYAIKDQPVDNGFADITGTLDTEYLNDTLFENYWQTDTYFSLIVSFTSATLAATGYPYSITFNYPRCRFLVGEDPVLAGPDIVKPSMQWEAMLDGTHPACTIVAVNTDSTL